MSKIGIIDYGMGNLGSVTNACRFLELSAEVVTTGDQLRDCEGLILPGVGAFGDGMAHLEEHGFVEPIREWIAADRPFLGICLGQQMLFAGSEESPGVRGLDVLPGVVRRFQLPPAYKVPHIGWSRVQQRRSACPLFAEIPDESYFYFVHSFYVDAAEADFAAGITHYGLPYASAVWRGRVAGVQFHPEKSQKLGLQMLRNFAAMMEK